MNINERTLTTTSTLNAQGSGGASNNSDEQAEPSSKLSIFSLDYKKYVNH
jgi:hypothetical protein